jgi:hypothetical protein
LRPRVAIMNNGATKGGAPEAFATLRHQPGLEDVWQLYASRNQNADNSADSFIANVDEGQTSYWIKLTANDGRQLHLDQWSQRVQQDVYGERQQSRNLARSPLNKNGVRTKGR